MHSLYCSWHDLFKDAVCSNNSLAAATSDADTFLSDDLVDDIIAARDETLRSTTSFAAFKIRFNVYERCLTFG